MYSIPTSASNKVKSATNHAPEHAGRNTANEALPYDGSRSPAEGPAVTGALSTPHDAILYELRGSQQIPEHTSCLHAETDPLQPPAPRLSMLPSFASERVDSQSGEGTSNGRRSAVGNVPVVVLERDALYDPVTGVLAGVIIPHPTDQSNDGRSGIEFNQAKDELWCHLGKIRELQSQIAGMHVQMEGLGLNDGTRGPKRPGGVSARMASDPIGVDDWVDGGDEEPNIKAEKDTEFSHLSESFGGRKVVIDNIMDKVYALRDNQFAYFDFIASSSMISPKR